MLTPIATVIFAAAMALSLSVEADSFFHPDTPSSTPDGEGAEDEATAAGQASAVATDGSTAEP